MNKDILMGIVNEEKFDISLYSLEANLFRNKIVGGDLISKTFEEFARDEIMHIKMLVPMLKKQVVFVNRKILPSNSLRKTLRIHIIRETDSIKLYEVLLNSIDSLEDKRIIQKIIENEKKHLTTIKKYLMKLL